MAARRVAASLVSGSRTCSKCCRIRRRIHPRRGLLGGGGGAAYGWAFSSLLQKDEEPEEDEEEARRKARSDAEGTLKDTIRKGIRAMNVRELAPVITTALC